MIYGFCWVLLVQHAHATPEVARYQSCVELSKTDPEAALILAEKGLRYGNLPADHHCKALALFTLKRYGEAAQALQILHDQQPADAQVMRMSLLRQSAKAWAMHGANDKAIKQLNGAIERLTAMQERAPARLWVEILLDRAQYLRLAGKAMSALQDLDHAVSLGALQDQALLARANQYQAMGEVALAVADIEAVLRENPSHPLALEKLAMLLR